MINPMWQPSANINFLKQRAKIIADIREFFAARDILEVETPLLCYTSVPDPYIESIPATLRLEGNSLTYYLQTSPEYAMKRLLAADCGSLYQICKAFRQSEVGDKHNPEFTMLEWYRIDFDHHQLMDEMDDLLQHVLQTPNANRLSYQQLFQHFLQIDPLSVTANQLAQLATDKDINVHDAATNDVDTWLDVLMTHCIEPQMEHDKPYFVYDYPASQSALARLQNTQPPVASRFEVYYKGVELANGFHELANAEEQRQRFTQQLDQRHQSGQSLLPLDERFLAALEHGLPNCAGVALGIDRLVMLATGCHTIDNVLTFSVKRA